MLKKKSKNLKTGKNKQIISDCSPFAVIPIRLFQPQSFRFEFEHKASEGVVEWKL